MTKKSQYDNIVRDYASVALIQNQIHKIPPPTPRTFRLFSLTLKERKCSKTSPKMCLKPINLACYPC